MALLIYFQQLPMKQDVSNYKITSIVFPSALVTGYEVTSGKQEIPVEEKEIILLGSGRSHEL